jgi:hypothetical protein
MNSSSNIALSPSQGKEAPPSKKPNKTMKKMKTKILDNNEAAFSVNDILKEDQMNKKESCDFSEK